MPNPHVLHAPPGLPTPQAKVDQIRTVMALVAGGLHVFNALMFTVAGYPRLAMLSVGSVVLFVGMLVLVRTGHSLVGACLGYTEAVAHSLILAWVLGPKSGFELYQVILVGAAFVGFTAREARYRLVGTVTPLVLGLVMHVLNEGREPLVAASPEFLSWLALINLGGALVGQVALVVWVSFVADRAEQQIETERERSERLLLNVLPASIATRLKANPGTIADAFPSVTVLFADIVGFTVLSAKLPTDELIRILNELFSTFDALAEKHGLEKIKTIGDAYMVVGGVPSARPDHAQAVAAMALEMRAAVLARPPHAGGRLDVRIGIHSGPVVAGVIGTSKFTYDLWGDTVNTASRMESHSEPSKIQVSEATRSLLDGSFQLAERGVITVKGKGEMRTWFLEAQA